MKKSLTIFSNKSNTQLFCLKNIFSFSTLVFLFLLFLFSTSCNSYHEKNQNNNSLLSPKFKIIDSLYLASNINKANVLINNLKKEIDKDNIEDLSHYYYYKGLVSYQDTLLMNKYADSALAIFHNEHIQKKYPNAFIKALMLKSDVYIYFKKYDDALESYFKIKSLLNRNENPILYADYISKIAQLYYVQHRFKQAARYNLEVIQILDEAQNTTPQAIFYIKQGALNNAGFSYEKAGILDSAAILYKNGLSYINEVETNKEVNISQTSQSRIVFLDNLGGLMAKKGDFLNAKKLLEQSIAINSYGQEKIKSTTYIKLANVYTQLKKLDIADSLLKIAEKVINEYPIDFYQLKPRVDKAKSDLYVARNNYEGGYLYLNKYISALDSANAAINNLSQIDLNLRFESIQNKQELKLLEETNANQTVYLVFAGVFILMFIPIGFLINKNIKQAKIVEKKTFEHNKQLEKTMLNLENRNKDYAKMMKVMAHDLKNPISGIVGIANLLLQEEDKFTPENREMFKLIENSGENSIEMINQLLNSGLAIENEILKKESIDIQQLLRQCTELLQYKADEKKQKIIFISGGPFIISISREKIWRVINNLIVNAIKFSPPKTEIIVVLERLAKGIRIKVVDQGIGIPDTDKEKIFEMFTSAKRTGTAGEQPFGIGLSTSKQIIESHKGKIWLEDNPDNGTIFYVELPA